MMLDTSGAHMKPAPIIRYLLFLLFVASTLHSQEIRVYQTYDPQEEVTRLMSSHLVLINSVEQFLEIQLVAAWPGESRQGPPKRIFIELTSRTAMPLYRGQDHRLVAVIDANTVDLGALGFSGVYHQLSAEFPSIYNFGGGATVVRVPIPPTALVKAANPEALLTAEILDSQDIQLDRLSELAHARHLTLKLESAAVDLTGDQMSILREFERSVTMPGVVTTEGRSPAEELQSGAPGSAIDLTSAPLELTLNWLREQIEANGTVTSVSGAASKTQLAEISGCKLTFRVDELNPVASQDFALLRPGLRYVVNLEDLNPEVTVISSWLQRAAIRFATHDNKRTIKVLTKQQVTGFEYDEKFDYSLSIELRKGDSVLPVRNAMLRAIRLCQAQP
jgi:hypothetical protein